MPAPGNLLALQDRRDGCVQLVEIARRRLGRGNCRDEDRQETCQGCR